MYGQNEANLRLVFQLLKKLPMCSLSLDLDDAPLHAGQVVYFGRRLRTVGEESNHGFSGCP